MGERRSASSTSVRRSSGTSSLNLAARLRPSPRVSRARWIREGISQLSPNSNNARYSSVNSRVRAGMRNGICTIFSRYWCAVVGCPVDSSLWPIARATLSSSAATTKAILSTDKNNLIASRVSTTMSGNERSRSSTNMTTCLTCLRASSESKVANCSRNPCNVGLVACPSLSNIEANSEMLGIVIVSAVVAASFTALATLTRLRSSLRRLPTASRTVCSPLTCSSRRSNTVPIREAFASVVRSYSQGLT